MKLFFNILCVLSAVTCGAAAGFQTIHDRLTVVDYSCRNLTAAQAEFTISAQQVSDYFTAADTITCTEAISLLSAGRTKYFVSGRVSMRDTLDFVIFPSGVAIVSSEPKVFLRGAVNIPADEYEPAKSPIRILSFDKVSLDREILEYWQQDDPGGEYHEGGVMYEACKRWKEKVFANEISNAFNLCRRVEDGSLNVDWNVDHHNYLYGFLIKDGAICAFGMNGGGVIEIYPEHLPKETYACYDPRGLAYFIQIVEKFQD